MAGRGWAVAAMTTPGGLGAFVQGSVAALTDRVLALGEVLELDEPGLVRQAVQAADDRAASMSSRPPSARPCSPPGSPRRAWSPRSPGWAQVAADLRYADQAHLVRDFRAATGRTPAAYAAAEPPEPGHLGGVLVSCDPSRYLQHGRCDQLPAPASATGHVSAWSGRDRPVIMLGRVAAEGTPLLKGFGMDFLPEPPSPPDDEDVPVQLDAAARARPIWPEG